MIQAGYDKEGANVATNCGTNTSAVFFIEYKVSNNINTPCNTYIGANVEDQFGVVQKSPGYWNAYINSILYETHYIGTDTGDAIAPAEWTDFAGTADGCWGCNGNLAWQYTTDKGTSYATIVSGGTQFNQGNTWSIGLLPSPFRIHN